MGVFMQHKQAVSCWLATSSRLVSAVRLPRVFVGVFRHKITTGLVRMYDGEVLCKFPIAQHFLFCELLPLK